MRRLALTLAAVALAVGAWFAFFRHTDEEDIRASLKRLATTVSVADDDHNVLFRTRRIDKDFEDLFDKDVRVSIAELPYVPSGRAELANTAADLPTAWRRADASFSGVTIKMDDAHESATVGATAKLDTSEGPETRNVDFLLRKTDSRWRIYSITVWPDRDR